MKMLEWMVKKKSYIKFCNKTDILSASSESVEMDGYSFLKKKKTEISWAIFEERVGIITDGVILKQWKYSTFVIHFIVNTENTFERSLCSVQNSSFLISFFSTQSKLDRCKITFSDIFLEII